MNEILLPNGMPYLIRQGDPDVIVNSGELRVFLQPKEDGRKLRRKYLGTAVQGDVIPAPPLKTAGKRLWTLICLPADSAVLMQMDPHSANRNLEEYAEESVFLLAGDLGQPEIRVAKQDFWQHAVDRYEFRNEDQKKSVRSRVEKRRTLQWDTLRRMRGTFTGHLNYEIASMESTDSPLYDAMVFLCNRRKTKIAPLQRIRRACSKEPGIQDISRISGFACRAVLLEKNWKKKIYEPFLAFLPERDGKPERPVVCFRNFGTFYLYDTAEGNYHRLSKDEEKQLVGAEGWTLLRPFDPDPMDLKNILHFCAGEISVIDILLLLLTMFMVTQIGIMLTTLNRIIYDQAIPFGDSVQAWTLGGICVTGLAANLLFGIGKSLTTSRLNKRLIHSLMTAILDRAFHMPEKFFYGQESAPMAYRIFHLAEMYVSVIQSGAQIILQLVFSLFYISRMFRYSPQLSAYGLGMAAVQAVLTAGRSVVLRNLASRQIGLAMQTRSLLYQSFSNIETIRAAGAEDQLLYKYMEHKTDMGRVRQKSDRVTRFSTFLFTLLGGVTMILLYHAMGNGLGISLGSFMAFMTANTLFGTVIMQVTQDSVSLSQLLPALKDATGLLNVVPEKSGQGQIPERLSGDIVLSHVSYKYDRNGEQVLDDLTLHIHPGEYVGIAGVSGSGKSTLIRILLGFSKPDMGQIYFDNLPISQLDLVELRRRIGSVLQDSKLIPGTIYENVSLTRPDASQEEVWQVLEMAAVKDDIKAMPMGLSTHVSEENQNISGGQKQRILLARALLGDPQILILDEATSALDNPTQNAVIRSMESLAVTRITVAHRLSTLRTCDRILLMDRGKVVEEGSFESLMERRGKFYEMVQVQKNA